LNESNLDERGVVNREERGMEGQGASCLVRASLKSMHENGVDCPPHLHKIAPNVEGRALPSCLPTLSAYHVETLSLHGWDIERLQQAISFRPLQANIAAGRFTLNICSLGISSPSRQTFYFHARSIIRDGA
jgi:hypothetical protein